MNQSWSEHGRIVVTYLSVTLYDAMKQIEIDAAFLTQEELRQRWKVSLMFIWRKRRDGLLPAYKIGKRGVRFAIADVLRIESESAA